MAICSVRWSFIAKPKKPGSNPSSGAKPTWRLAAGSKRIQHLAHNDYYHLILLATNLKGYQNLIKLVSKAYLEGFYYKPRMDKEIFQEHHEGLDRTVRLSQRGRSPI